MSGLEKYMFPLAKLPQRIKNTTTVVTFLIICHLLILNIRKINLFIGSLIDDVDFPLSEPEKPGNLK
jgi:hypothetical protein